MNLLSYSPSIFVLRNTFIRSFHITGVNYAQPTKAKKKADPMTDKIREDRKRRRYEKVINKLEKFKLQLKPIHEYEAERRILKELDVRKRPSVELTPEETTRRLMLNRDWAKHKHRQHQQEITFISLALKSQEEALKQLKIESEQLYEKALEVDSKLIPFIRRGPLYSLPNPNYDAPDGDYFDTTNYFSKGFGINFMEHMKNIERQKWTEIRAERRVVEQLFVSLVLDMLVKHLGSCHCGAVKFEVEAPADLRVFRCNCSLCRKKQNNHFIVPKRQFTLLSGADYLTTYTFNTHVAQHIFCRRCGVQSFYSPRSNPDCYGVMPHCIDSPTIKSIEYLDFDGEHWEDSMNKCAEIGEKNPFNIK